MRSPRFVIPVVIGLSLGAAACRDDVEGNPLQGVREPCSTAGGTLLGCDQPPIDTPEDACWRLVECGAIPLEHEENWVLDWASCVHDIERLSEPRYEFALECIETSSCDDLKVDLCLQYGDPP